MEAVPEQDAKEFYSYQPLNLNKATIRLVQILPDLSSDGLVQCRIYHNTLEALYTCLSYRWGAPDPNGLILINDKLFRVRQNLLDFLYMARENAETAWLFWIDAICIDQSQVLERNHQVAQMGEIFLHATRVDVWLGANSDLEHAFRIIKDPDSATPREWDIIFAKRKLLEEYICDNQYWERAWIVQEIFLARTVLVWLDRQCVRFEDLDWSIDYFNLPWRISPIARFKLSTKDILNPRKPISKFEEAKSLYNGAILPTLLANFYEMKCEIPRDRIFSLLSMSADARGYSVDYSSSDFDTCLEVLQKCGNLSCLCAPRVIADSIGLSEGLESFEARCCVLEYDVPDFISSRFNPDLNQSSTALFRSVVRYYYESWGCQTLENLMNYMESMDYDENKECWFADDFNLRILGPRTIVMEILLSSLNKLTRKQPTVCANLQLGGCIAERAVKYFRIRFQQSIEKNTINISGQGALPADLLLRDEGIGVKTDGQKDGT